jgi:ATP-dependent exoDNAse (exonuclease V) beta subunit
MNDTPIADVQARLTALDPVRSFIVQAPAGSGKTGLLVQRLLALLARVDAPEEILAITFTRKAAAEMRGRVLGALQEAANMAAPSDPHARATWLLAGQVLARDREQGWQLLHNPARLRLQTIDSLCASLARQMPVLTQMGVAPSVVQDAMPLYREAAQRTLMGLEHGEWGSASVRRLVAHLDNNLPQVVALLSAMLAQRDQWLRHLPRAGGDAQTRRQLEAALAAAVRDALSELRGSFSAQHGSELVQLAAFAATNAETAKPPLRLCEALSELPAADAAALPVWQVLAELLLAKDGQWRKTVNVAQGFPVANKKDAPHRVEQLKTAKQRMVTLLEDLADAQSLRLSLHSVRSLPVPRYSDEQWALLAALFELLPLAVAQLRVVFAESGGVDFAEVARMALTALGEPQAPTDLALALDYRIKHILVDEFQDTSFGQYELLEALTAGWTAGDGRTLFVVGDPMQSIYRFRAAEVGLFLWARQRGLAGLPLEPLTLSVNFRSDEEIVAWVNRTFARIFPDKENVDTGAVPCSLSAAVRTGAASPCVEVHPCLRLDRTQEATRVVALVQAAQQQRPQGTVAVLVRSRRHLGHIVAAFNRAGVRFQAIEIEALGQRPVVQDLLALTRALLHGGDRSAWLGVLRAPWCGLTLDDLHSLAGGDFATPLWQLMQDPARRDLLSPTGARRVTRVSAALGEALAQRRWSATRSVVEAAWLALGGPACAATDSDLVDAEAFFALLDALDTEGNGENSEALVERVSRLYAAPRAEAGTQVQLMTIHKSKGLEFDTVIVPGLGSRAQADDKRLLLWMERPSAQREGDLMLAPISAAGSAVSKDPLYGYLSYLDREKARHEATRLLYVAVTRARRKLHLLGHTTVKVSDTGRTLQSPEASSLLGHLWPVVEPAFRAALTRDDETVAVATTPAAHTPALLLRRLPQDWALPTLPDSPALAPPVLPPARRSSQGNIEFLWASPAARHVGTVVHRLLRQIGLVGGEGWSEQRLMGQRHAILQSLSTLGVPTGDLPWASERVVAAVVRTLGDSRGCWLLSRNGRDAHCELALSGVVAGELVNAVIDRTFVDDEGVRWIVDYKTGYHADADVDAFLDQEQHRYRPQLATYAALFRGLESRPLRLGLYFPLLAGWREWDAAEHP